MSRKRQAQVPKGKKRPKGYGEAPASAQEIMDRLRKSPPRPKRRRSPPTR